MTQTTPATPPPDAYPVIVLRDYFAAQALEGMIAHLVSVGAEADAARRAYVFADAMLAERVKGKK